MIYTNRIPVQGPKLDNFSFPEDQTLMVVGDTHGQSGALRDLLKGMGRMPTPGKKRTLVFLGDLIDRGPDSVGCMKTAFSEGADLAQADDVVFLPGNHELMMADGIREARQGAFFVGKGSAAEIWAMNGGMAFMTEVFEAHGVDAPSDSAEMLVAFADLLPHPGHADVVEMINSWPSHFRMGDVLCVHAGVRPKKPLDYTLSLTHADHLDRLTNERHWAWIREPFLAWQGGWSQDGTKAAEDGALVIHGHTVPLKCTRRMEHGDDLKKAFDRMATNARICVDGGSARSIGVAGTIIAEGAARILFAPT